MDYKIAQRLQSCRKEHGYSQEELADILNVSRQAVSKWERGEASPDTENIIAFAKIYNITIDELINGKTPSNDAPTAEPANDFSADGEDKDKDNSFTAKQGTVISLVSGITLLASLIVYVVLGCCLNLWHPGWIIFFLLPLAVTLADAILKRKFVNFAYPVLVAAAYLLVGFLTGLWHPCWVMFLTIPVYYIILDVINARVKK